MKSRNNNQHMLDNADILIYITIVPEAVFVITQLPAAYSQTEKINK